MVLFANPPYLMAFSEFVDFDLPAIFSTNGYSFPDCGYCHFAMAGCQFHHVPKVLYSVRHHGGDRKTGQHTDERYKNLLEESRRCAWRARDFQNSGNQAA